MSDGQRSSCNIMLWFPLPQRPEALATFWPVWPTFMQVGKVVSQNHDNSLFHICETISTIYIHYISTFKYSVGRVWDFFADLQLGWPVVIDGTLNPGPEKKCPITSLWNNLNDT